MLTNNLVEVNAYRYWMACKAIDHWTDSATIVLYHLMQSDHPRIKARACDLFNRAQLMVVDETEDYPEGAA